MGRAVLHLSCLVCDRKWAWHLSGLRRELFGRARTVALYAAVAALTVQCVTGNPMGYYTEPFRPQFHFTPEKNWMNDPNGLVYYQGQYNLFYQYNPFGNKWGHMSWGHAVSPDLVHWKHLPLALPEANGIMCFSGSAVVDWHNTSGFGRNGQPPLVAIYTGMRVADGRQFQCIAYSNNGGLTWTKYAGNPVIDIGSENFRDPKVQWYAPTKNWIMTVALSAEHKIAFYGSKDLKHWTLLSEFGPAGATGGVWECPDLFPLPVDGNTNQMKWVLIVNINPGGPAGGSGTQYFVGDFDGQRFQLDPTYPKPTPPETHAAEGKVLADFEGASYGNWKTTGNAFGSGPAQPGSGLTGYTGHGVADSFGTGDADQGTLQSPEFNIDANYLGFSIGGGNHAGQVGINLLVDGKVVRTATGNNSSELERKSWDVREFKGKEATLEIFDRYSGNDWGHIIVDQIVLSDTAPVKSKPQCLWLDYGRDFYAGVTWSDMPANDHRRVLLGWMSNWDYGQDVPTSPWRSAMTVPRTLTLHRTPEGLRLFQQPVKELNTLREGKPLVFGGGTFAEAADWLSQQQDLSKLQDMQISLEDVSFQTPFSLDLVTGSAEQTSVVCDTTRGQIVVDRTHSGLTRFHQGFAGRYAGPLHLGNGHCKLHLLLDTSSLEVFAQDGNPVLTDLIFPTGKTRTWRLTKLGEKAPMVKEIKIYPLKSIWDSGRSPDATDTVKPKHPAGSL